jgi:integrase
VSKYLRNKRWTLRVPHPYGGSVEKGIGTGNTKTAEHYETMCAMMLAHPMDHVFLIAVCTGGLKLKTLYSHWVRKTLDALRAEVTDIDVAPQLAAWRNLLVREFGEPTSAEHTARKYVDQVQQFFAYATGVKPRTHYDAAHPIYITKAPLSLLTPARATQWMASREVSSSTQRRYWAALESFVGFLLKMKVIERSPIESLDAPAANDPRTRHLTPGERDALIDAAPEGPVRTAEVLAHMGLERSAFLAARVSDVDLKARTVYAHGTKHQRGRTNYRSRAAHIPDWAIPHLKAAVRLQHPKTLLVPLPYGQLRRAHSAACELAGITDYRLHDGRHTYAVYMKRAGVPSEVIGLQLGHKDGTQVERVYGRYHPTSEELARWSDLAERHHATGAR